MTPYLFPIISFIVFIASIYLYCKPIVFPRALSFAIYFVISSIWIVNLGFCGNDIPIYLRKFADYTIENPFFFSYTEFSVGIFSGLFKLLYPTQNEYLVASLYRFFVFVIIPCSLILFSPTARIGSIRLLSLLAFVALIPYAFLSATNIINNGLSFAFLYYYLLSSLTRTLLFSGKSWTFTWLEIFLLFFAAFAHPFGLGIISLSLFALAFLGLTQRFSVLTLPANVASVQFASFIIAPLSCIASIAAFPRISSTVNDSTVLVSSVVMIYSLILFRQSLLGCFSRCLFDLNPYSGNSFIFFRRLFLLSCLFAFFSFFIVLMGAGDAGERLVASLISWFSLLSLLLLHIRLFFGPARTLMSGVSSNFVQTRSFSIPFVSLSILALMGAQLIYFYLSTAFLHNSTAGPYCL